MANEGNILIISGFDPSGGAGLIQDTFIAAVLGCRPSGCVSAYTEQNTNIVNSIIFRTNDEIISEISILEKPDVIKIGICNPSLLEILSDRYKKIPLIWNPVLRSSSGYRFLDSEEVRKYINYSDWVVVNSEEAQEIGISENMIITGGHLEEENIEIFIGERKVKTIPRISGNFHGTGCAFSTAFAVLLSYSYPPDEAVRSSAELLNEILNISNKSVNTYKVSNFWLREKLIEEIEDVMDKLSDFGDLITPEVGLNISYALPGAKNEESIANVPGRMRLHRGKGKWVGKPSFGNKSHTARMILAMMKKFPFIRCCMNICYEAKYIESAKRNNFFVYELQRENEPEEFRDKEGNSLNRGITSVIEDIHIPPDVIFDRGFWGKEAMIRIFARNPSELLIKLGACIFAIFSS